MGSRRTDQAGSRSWIGGGNARPIYPVLPPPPGQPYSVRRSRLTWLIPAFVVVNVVMFIVSMGINNCPKKSLNGGCVLRFLGRFSFEPLRENPLLGPSADTLLRMGGLESVRVVKDHEGWRLFTCIWLHGGVLHIVVNMISLVFIGARLEREFGFIRIGVLYVLAGFGGSIMSALFLQNQISVGASGALFGLLGAMISELIMNWTIYSNKCAVMTTLLIIIVVNLAVGVLPHVDNFAHIGGFISGFLLGFVLLMKPQYGWVRNQPAIARHDGTAPIKSKHKVYQYIFWIAASILLVSGYAAGIILLFKGVDVYKRCSWCHYLNCIPTSRWHCDNGNIACQTSFDKGYLTLTCMNNGKSKDFFKVTNATSTQLSVLCSQNCS